MANLYINLLVTDLAKATAFYEALGFTKNLEFSNEDASAMKYDDSLCVMLLTHGFCANFLGSKTISDAHTTTEVLNALQLDSREAVDAFFDKAIAAGVRKQSRPMTMDSCMVVTSMISMDISGKSSGWTSLRCRKNSFESLRAYEAIQLKNTAPCKTPASTTCPSQASIHFISQK